jgi:hypothetical protein
MAKARRANVIATGIFVVALCLNAYIILDMCHGQNINSQRQSKGHFVDSSFFISPSTLPPKIETSKFFQRQ